MKFVAIVVLFAVFALNDAINVGIKKYEGWKEVACSKKFSCKGRPYGKYALGCSNRFVMCISEITYCMKCPSGLVFEPKLQKCIARNVCSVCRHRKPANNEPKEHGSHSSSESHEHSSKHRRFCTFKADGNYALGCSSHFASCVGGITYIMHCAAHLKFDPSSNACRDAYFVRLCGGHPYHGQKPPMMGTLPEKHHSSSWSSESYSSSKSSSSSGSSESFSKSSESASFEKSSSGKSSSSEELHYHIHPTHHHHHHHHHHHIHLPNHQKPMKPVKNVYGAAL
ncbi:hypothetical protein AB6A40_002479 [Gnathostoma spinigerum]|uniref:Chitin-binding type-2 domain-containing protein n=1 Tax=Gnathostoma spinigerum TaxID=75299 RepID=A0ABD6E6P4_9BILA